MIQRVTDTQDKIFDQRPPAERALAVLHIGAVTA